uniref:DNA binding protein n=1 Tax=Rhizophora mucronata TaxID=61149 RepID=A0A2P2MJW8_RHIMU
MLLTLAGEPTPLITGVFGRELDLRFEVAWTWCCRCNESLALEVKDGAPPTAGTELIAAFSFCNPREAVVATAPK